MAKSDYNSPEMPPANFSSWVKKLFFKGQVLFPSFIAGMSVVLAIINFSQEKLEAFKVNSSKGLMIISLVVALICIILIFLIPRPKEYKIFTDRAGTALEQFLGIWKFLWFTWVVMYGFWAIKATRPDFQEKPATLVLSIDTDSLKGDSPKLKDDTITHLKTTTLTYESLAKPENNPVRKGYSIHDGKSKVSSQHVPKQFEVSIVTKFPYQEIRSSESKGMRINRFIFSTNEGSRIGSIEKKFWVIWMNFLNNLQTLAMVLCYIVLAKSTYDIKRHKGKIPWIEGAAIVVIFTIVDVMINVLPPDIIDPQLFQKLSVFLKWICGLGAGISIALFAGRFDSKFIGAPSWCIIALYLYALIQVPWVQFEANPQIELILVFVALFLKCLLFLLVAWTLHSGVMYFYLEKVAGLLENAGKEREEYLAKMWTPDQDL